MQQLRRNERGRKGRTAETRGRVYLPVWWEPSVLAVVLATVGVLRLRGKYRAGLSDAVKELGKRGTRKVFKGVTAEEMRRAVELIGRGYPGFKQAAAYAATVRQRTREDGAKSTHRDAAIAAS